MNAETTLTIFAIIAVLGLTGVIAAESISISQQAEAAALFAKCPAFSFQFNASQGRCFHPK